MGLRLEENSNRDDTLGLGISYRALRSIVSRSPSPSTSARRSPDLGSRKAGEARERYDV